MSRTFEKTGRTIKEAIEMACDELNLKEERLKYEILEEPNNGFLGFGTKKAKIKVFVNDDDDNTEEEKKENNIKKDKNLETNDISEEELFKMDYVIEGEKFLKNILSRINNDFSITKKVINRELIFNIEGENVGLIIGKRGQTLNSLQYLFNIVANKNSDSRVRITLDAANYRDNRKKSLYELSNKIADRVKENGKSIELEPMNSSERKTIHIALKDNEDVYTYSKGDEPYRKVVISSKNKRRRRSNLFENS